MGFSQLTRYNLFQASGDLVESSDGIIQYNNPSEVRKMYYDSAHLIREFEDIINNNSYFPSQEEYQELYHRALRQVNNPDFADQIDSQLQLANEKIKKSSSSSESYKTFFKYLLKTISDYQDKIIKYNFIGLSNSNMMLSTKKQTFLSYAYYDKGLTQALFYYFWVRSGFLYVNWMWSGVNTHSSITKEELERALLASDQLLFLRTPNSELKLRGNFNNIRQWCACGEI